MMGKLSSQEAVNYFVSRREALNKPTHEVEVVIVILALNDIF